jgi:hypothetical protein
MVATKTSTETADGPGEHPESAAPRAWLWPGEQAWEVWTADGSGGWKLGVSLEEGAEAPARIDYVALPPALLTCLTLWLETTDEKVAPDLIRLQCERRALLRHGEVWSHRIIRREADRMLAQVSILQNTAPAVIEASGDARYEAAARCLPLSASSAVVWRSLGHVCLALRGEDDVVYYQSLPHQELTRECVRDIQAVFWQATAQRWVDSVSSLTLVGEWQGVTSHETETILGVSVDRVARLEPASPVAPQELTPHRVRKQRTARQRRHRMILGALGIAAVYILFLVWQISSGFILSMSNHRLQTRLDGIMPAVTEMQTTARQLEALNPAIDVKTYPLELLYRAVSVLPENGVRLTRFEIVGNRIEIGGESSTAREAFDYISQLESLDSLRHVEWEEAPQPVPLPNDTTRFSIQGTITGAYHESEET